METMDVAQFKGFTCGRYLLATVTGNTEESRELMLTPTQFPGDILNIALLNPVLLGRFACSFILVWI